MSENLMRYTYIETWPRGGKIEESIEQVYVTTSLVSLRRTKNDHHIQKYIYLSLIVAPSIKRATEKSRKQRNQRW